MTDTLEAGIQSIGLDDVQLKTRRTDEAFLQYAKDQPGDKHEFYELEAKVLNLWDRLHDLKLELAVLEANDPAFSSSTDTEIPSTSEEEIQQELSKAEKECLNARAEYLLRQSVVEDTLTVGPILNAVHSPRDNASPTERALRPLINRRDGLQIALTNLSSSLQSVQKRTLEVQLEDNKIRDKSRPLAREVIDVAQRIESRKKEVKQQDSGLNEKIQEATKEADTAAQQWRTMKSVVAAIVVGSGVNWADDEELRNIVLDAEDEND